MVQLDGEQLASVKVLPTAGFVGIGTSSFIRAAFDNIQISYGKCIILVLQILSNVCNVSAM